MIYKQHREIEISLSSVLCCLFSYSKISKRIEGVSYQLLLINHTACTGFVSRYVEKDLACLLEIVMPQVSRNAKHRNC